MCLHSPDRDRRGFTLVEMIVTLTVLAILVALSMFGAQSFLRTGHDSDARARLREVAQAQVSLANQWGMYSEYSGDFAGLAGSTKVTHLVSSGSDVVSANVGSAGSLGLALRSVSGKCLYMRVEPLVAGGDALDVTAQVPASAPCRGVEALPETESATTPAEGPVQVKQL